MRPANLTPHPVTFTTGTSSVHRPPEYGALPRIYEIPEAAEPMVIAGLSVCSPGVNIIVVPGLQVGEDWSLWPDPLCERPGAGR